MGDKLGRSWVDSKQDQYVTGQKTPVQKYSQNDLFSNQFNQFQFKHFLFVLTVTTTQGEASGQNQALSVRNMSADRAENDYAQYLLVLMH